MLSIALRMMRDVDPAALWTLTTNLLAGGARSVKAFERRSKRGEFFPAFLFLSVTDRCTLDCEGCWVTRCTPARDLPEAAIRAIIETARRRDVRVFGWLGGEPLLRPELVELSAERRDCYFVLFTNGMLLDAAYAERLRRARNVSPLISVEGAARESDRRRGGHGVYHRALAAIEACRSAGLVTGVATSVCQSSFDDVVNRAFLDEMAERGVHYVWYYIYRPVGARPAEGQALTREQIVALRRFIVDARMKAPVMIVDAYWDHEGRPLCPAATGIAGHIGPEGWIEPCPPVQFSDRRASASLAETERALSDSPFWTAFRGHIPKATRGCVLLDRPDALADLAQSVGANDTSGRGSGASELRARRPCASHDLGADAIPERNRLYRMAKKRWLFGLGAYG